MRLARLGTGGIWLGVALLATSLIGQPDPLDFSAKRDVAQCVQKRRVATLNGTDFTSADCDALLQQRTRRQLLMAAGIVLLAGGGIIRKKSKPSGRKA